MILIFESPSQAHPEVKAAFYHFGRGDSLLLTVRNKRAIQEIFLDGTEQTYNYHQNDPCTSTRAEMILVRDGLLSENAAVILSPLLCGDVFYLVHHHSNGTDVHTDNEKMLEKLKPNADWFSIAHSHVSGDIFFKELPAIATEIKATDSNVYNYYHQLLSIYNRFRLPAFELKLTQLENDITMPA